MPNEEYGRLRAEGDALADRVRGYCEDAGRDVAVGVYEGRNAPRYTVIERGHGKIPVVTWTPAWDGWLEKAEQDCRTAGLLPTEEEIRMPQATEAEVARSTALRDRMRPLVREAGGAKEFVKVAVTIMEDRGHEPFGGVNAATAPQQIAEIQVSKFLDVTKPSDMLDRNLTKWEGIINQLEEHFFVDAQVPQPESGVQIEAGPPAAGPTLSESAVERLREDLAARDDELKEAKDEVRKLKTEIAEKAGHRSEVIDLERSRANDLTVQLARVEEHRDALEEQLKEAQEFNAAREAEMKSMELSAVDESEARPMSLRDMRGYEEQYGGGAARVISFEVPSPSDPIQDDIRRRYGDTLLRLLDKESPDVDHASVMERLDRIAGLDSQAA